MCLKVVKLLAADEIQLKQLSGTVRRQQTEGANSLGSCLIAASSLVKDARQELMSML